MTPHPEGKNTAGILNGWSYVIPADAKNPTDAKKFLQFINTSDNMGFFTDTFPARISSLKLPRFQDPLLKPFAGMLQYGRPSPNTAHWVEISQAMFNGIQRILAGATGTAGRDGPGQRRDPGAARRLSARAIRRRTRF